MRFKQYGIIYKAVNKINGKCYIGQTIRSLNERIKKHLKDKYYFSNSLKKYKLKNFKWQILCECNSKKELNEMEHHYIKQYDTLRPNGYNLTLGGEGCIGYKHTKETKNRISRKNKGRLKGKNNPIYGKTRSNKTKQKISKTKIESGICKGKNNSNAKSLILIHPNNDEEFFNYGREACKKYNLTPSALSEVITGKRKHHKGYKAIRISNEI